MSENIDTEAKNTYARLWARLNVPRKGGRGHHPDRPPLKTMTLHMGLADFMTIELFELQGRTPNHNEYVRQAISEKVARDLSAFCLSAPMRYCSTCANFKDPRGLHDCLTCKDHRPSNYVPLDPDLDPDERTGETERLTR